MKLIVAKQVALNMARTGPTPDKVHEWATNLTRWLEERIKTKKQQKVS